MPSVALECFEHVSVGDGEGDREVIFGDVSDVVELLAVLMSMTSLARVPRSIKMETLSICPSMLRWNFRIRYSCRARLVSFKCSILMSLYALPILGKPLR